MNIRNARLAGITFLLYYATALGDTFLFRHVSGGGNIAARLANIAQHVAEVRLTIVFALLTILYALILAVMLYALTRNVDRELALLALSCRFIEGVLNAVPAIVRLALLSLAMAMPSSTNGDASAIQTQAAVLLKIGSGSATVSGTIFAAGSTLFAYLFLKGRSIPAPLAWIGVIGSLLVIPVFPLSGMRMVSGSVVWLASIPLIIFELVFAFWLIFKGVKMQAIGAYS